MRRVAILGPMPAGDAVGGVAVHTDRLSAHLAAEGRAVTVLADSHANGWPVQETRQVPNRAVLGVRGASLPEVITIALPHPVRTAGVKARAVLSSERRALRVPLATAIVRGVLVGTAVRTSRAEVLHLQQADFRPLFADWAGVRVPRVVTVHGLGGLATGEYPALRDIVPANLHRADAIVTPSRALADEVGALGVPLERVRVVPNGVDRDIFHARDRATCRGELGLDPEAPLAVYIGRVTRHKGAGDLLAAWPLVRDAVPAAALVFVGPLGDGLDPTAAGARHADAVAHERAAIWMGAADVVVVPSRYEGFGLTALEAMASGRAVVAARVGGLAEVVPERAGALVAVSDTDALAEAIARLLADRAAADAAGAAGERAASAYTWESTARAYGSLYDAL